ncbi:fatty acyl-CoA reductase 1-like [Chrysoperla carnea]|uniref:fatty acyl-CoA reductase 1-like n=1 Tax=Chrysoperla carnea TaxID=189513 RepID=UPI001D096017|nr:fatty acyl-CoA reductase 1-like [Chrysoperla carnea]
MKVFLENVTLTQLPPNAPSVSEFYAYQNILITGGTGFMGKVLIEKLLRSCPKISAIYLLMRAKRDYTDEDRLNKIFNIPLFDRLKTENPEALSKVKIIKGDISEIKYGLSDVDMEFLINKINIVFHVAASVRFDNPLKEAILINTRGTRELLRIAKQMKNLKVFLHTSTTYCNIDKETDAIEEKIYKATTDWKTMIDAAENMDENTLNFLEKKILNKYPNTYTFAKNLAEEVVAEYCEDIPSVIFRPTVVVASQKEPIPGWVDNFNGPMGLVTGVLSGVLHTVYIDTKKNLDWVPVDIAIKGMITAAWYKALEKSDRNKCLVTNSSTTDFIQVSNAMLFEYGVATKGMADPYAQLLWYPFCFPTPHKYLFWFYVVMFHLIPSMFFSVLLKFSKQRLNLWKLYRRVFYTNMCLAPFTLNEWLFKNDNFKSLDAILKSEDKEEFSVNYSEVPTKEYFDIGQDGAARYLLKDKNFTKETLDKRLSNLKIKFYIHIVTVGIFIIGFLFVVNLFAQLKKF